MKEVKSPYTWFADLAGRPLQNGYVYIGVEGQDPETHPVSVYFDEAGTIPATQPLRTVSGYVSRDGSPARIYVTGGFSIRARTVQGAQVFYAPSATTSDTSSVFIVATFASIASAHVPTDVNTILTSSHRADKPLGPKGGAFYVRDTAVNGAFVTAHPGWSTLDAQGNGWRLSTDQDIKLSMFGAVLNDGRPALQADVTPYWLKAKNFLHFYREAAQGNSYYKTTPKIEFDEEYYFASAAFDLDDGVYHIKGKGNGTIGCTTIFMQGAQCGFILQSWDTAGVGGFKANTPSGASHTIIEDIFVQGTSEDLFDLNRGFPNQITPAPRVHIVPPATLLGNDLHCGFLIKCPAKLIRCRAVAFGGWGIAVRADVNVGGNANNTILQNCEAAFNYGGLLLSGGDVNAFGITDFNSAGNITWGIWDKSFLGGSFRGGHLQGNGSGQYNAGPYWMDFNPTTGAWAPGSYARKRALTNYAGQTWRIVPGQEVAASTTTPGTNAAVWVPYGAYDNASNPRYGTWVSGTQFVSGGAMYISDINCKSSVVGLYMEYDQPLGQMHPASRATVIGGFCSWDNGPFWNANNGKFWSKPTVRVGGEVIQFTETTPIGFRLCDNDENHLTYWEWTSHDLLMTYNLQPERAILRITGQGTAKTFGRSTTLPDALQIYKPIIGDDTHGRLLIHGPSAPTAGAYAQGDTIINNGSITSIASVNMWRCTVSGTPGTWVTK